MNGMGTLKLVRIFSHVACEHPGYLCEYLERRKIRYEKIYIDQVEPVQTRLMMSRAWCSWAPLSVSTIPCHGLPKNLRLSGLPLRRGFRSWEYVSVDS